MLLLDTLPMLGNVLLLCFFVFFIFGIVGVQLWEGILRQRCELVLPPNVVRPKYVFNMFTLDGFWENTSWQESLRSVFENNRKIIRFSCLLFFLNIPMAQVKSI